jgi:haloalkane dehalogenase
MMMPTLLRTPDERFVNLPDYSFAPHYVEINGARVHYVDEGEGEIILCLHGEPSWSYLYRKMIPLLAAQYRVIAPDFIGFGKSDKYAERDAYTIQMHRDTLVGLIEALDLNGMTLVCQDWGGLIGLRVATELPERFAQLVIMNTGLPDGTQHLPEALQNWRDFAARVPDLPIARVIKNSMAHPEAIPDAVLAAYEAPFPDASYKAGAAVFPALIPTAFDDPGAAEMRAARAALAQWQKPALIMFSDQDPITRDGKKFFKRLISHAQQIDIVDAGHFLQEEKGEELAQHILAFVGQSA